MKFQVSISKDVATVFDRKISIPESLHWHVPRGPNLFSSQPSEAWICWCNLVKSVWKNNHLPKKPLSTCTAQCSYTRMPTLRFSSPQQSNFPSSQNLQILNFSIPAQNLQNCKVSSQSDHQGRFCEGGPKRSNLGYRHTTKNGRSLFWSTGKDRDSSLHSDVTVVVLRVIGYVANPQCA